MLRDTRAALRTPASNKTFMLIGQDGTLHPSLWPGTVGGHYGGKLYGRLDCRAALQAIARGGYAKHRVFFADESTTIATGYRPCAVCMPQEYAVWKKTPPVKSRSNTRKEVRA